MKFLFLLLFAASIMYSETADCLLPDSSFLKAQLRIFAVAEENIPGITVLTPPAYTCHVQGNAKATY